MLVRDLVHNNSFDCNCDYEIYDCTDGNNTWGDGAEIIYSTRKHDLNTTLDSVLDMRIKYITTDKKSTIIIEATR